MACYTRIICNECRSTKMEVRDNDRPSICYSCRLATDMNKRAQYLKDLEALTIEERLSRIEAWIYDYKPTYVGPPSFG